MDTKKFLENLSDKLVLPILIIVIVGLSYLAFSAKSRLKSVQSELSRLHLKLQKINLDQNYVGTRLSNELITLINSKLKAQNNSKVKYCVLQFISLDACTPCAKENIDLFRQIATTQDNTMFFWIVKDSVNREVASLKQYYRLDFPSHFIVYNPQGLNSYFELPTLLTTTDGIILLRYISDPDDEQYNDLHRKILRQFVTN